MSTSFSKMDAIEYSYYAGDSVASLALYALAYSESENWPIYRMWNLSML